MVCATAPDMAPAPSLPMLPGLDAPSGVKCCRTLSYTMKLSPTYGATPATVGINPRYSALMPPSCLYIWISVAHMPGSFFSASAFDRPLKDADWIDKRVRTMSRGYVTVTDVMPAIAPQHKRLNGVRGSPGSGSKN